MIKRITITLLISLWAQYAMAWGSIGHRAIAQIAYEHLDSNTKKEVANLLGDDYLPLYANWADEIKSAQDSLKPLGKIPHYVNMKANETFDMVKESGIFTVYTAFEEQLAIVSDVNKSTDERGIALKLLIHFVADMHQPMHCGRPGDRGGNNIKVTWFGEQTNLHRVWDSNLIEYTKLSYTELAIFSISSEDDEIETIAKATPDQWLNESKTIADDIYANVGNGKFYYSYPYKYLDVVYSRIEKAGIRLAEVLNEAL